MSSIGEFREGEIDGKPFHIYTFSSQTHIPTAVDSGDDNDHSLQPLFFCPSSRLKVENSKREYAYSSKNKVRPFNTSPHFSDEQVQQLLDHDGHYGICKLPLTPLFKCNDKDPDSYDCKTCRTSSLGDTSYYFCVTCQEQFHKECVEAPVEIKHPSYPFLSLQLYPALNDLGFRWMCISCKNPIYDLIYLSPTYSLFMHLLCAMKPISIFIDHPKRHPHSLTFFPKQNFLPCNVCGLIYYLSPTYVCSRCAFIVHQDCIYFPYVIRICRHQHRICFTYSLPSGILSCGVCRKKVDNSYGAYSCNKCDDYFVHSRCALRLDLWDGEELEGIPEEPEVVVEPFETVADGIILHFSHGHHLKLEISRDYDDYKYCQACVLPIYEGNYYSCVDQCDFTLHEGCANCPLKKHHPLDARSLTLKAAAAYGSFLCSACGGFSCGFVYCDSENRFRLDVRCASVSEPFKYEGHEHPLFLALNPKEEESAICQICQNIETYRPRRKLNCIECDYVICFQCATLPYKARYKHDKHFLTFREVTEASDQSGWCEICERELGDSRMRGFYACDEYCCTTLHVHCLLGKDPYMKPGQTIEIYQDEVRILRNNTMSRPFCHALECDKERCPYKVFFEKKNRKFCSFNCLI